MIRKDPADVVVVGAGFGGAAFTWRLANRVPGLQIVCLERGGWIDHATMPPAGTDWQRQTMGDWATYPNLRLKSKNPAPSAD